MDNDFTQISRRRFAAGFALGSVALALPLPLRALTVDEARALVDKAVGDINKVINSGKSETAMYGDFERIFSKYADVAVIARSALGPAAKSASSGQMNAFTKAYQGYISRKYGRRFREFIGGTIEVTGAQPVKSYYEVISVAHLKGEAPFDLRWHVSDKSGRNLFFNIIIEGVNMLASERAEIGAMLDKRKGDLDALIGDLKSA
ncbi:MAG: ABC transporter substrate-binding protein [Rhodobacteraceae bacterium]|uniref:MlaC/ttg2D family ABC transporter substrate-binding protein n=1 Tax=Tabrizicola sp. SY72 TaxID=2741673 RepID=UPI001573CEE9|nr:ABC transporter substrate-binding protein [Tabrizicola sp. SY72]MBL9055164.1 ABC transporter substrate-binding protein [Paracoccaceae bacterium]NTT87795.1 ABC transporter substrate-binding protein [Tabrizicola sp. SY72]